MNQISGKMMFFGYLSGAKEIILHKNHLNQINVFPVPDGDTGSNLSSTMRSIIREAKYHDSVKTSLLSIADSALKGARGNSGIIFAQYLLGLAMETLHDVSLNSKNFVFANIKAVDYAYKAISNPVEGTIITVMKEWANTLERLNRDSLDFTDLLTQAYAGLEEAVKKTTRQLKVLKANKVVDSGAKGFSLFIQGFLKHIQSGKEECPDLVVQEEEIEIEQAGSHDITELQSRYCCEAMLENIIKPIDTIRTSLLPLGESLLSAGNEKRAKFHTHTNQPIVFFELLSQSGTITYQKVDDILREFDIVKQRKYPIALVTDSIADLPHSFCDENQIHVIPLNLLLRETNYLDKLSIDNLKVIQYIEQSRTLPTSSQPDYKTVENLYSFLSTYYKEIIVITVAEALSGTFNLCTKVAEDRQYKDCEIRVIDSKLNSAAQGLIVMRCAEYIQQSMPLHEIIDKIQQDIRHSKIWVNVKTISNMIKAGRLSKRSGQLAQLLGLKPIVSLDENGKGILDGIAFSFHRSMKKSIMKMAAIQKQKKIQRYAVVHVHNSDEANRMAERLEAVLHQKPAYIEEVSSITSVSAGDGAIALAFMTE